MKARSDDRTAMLSWKCNLTIEPMLSSFTLMRSAMIGGFWPLLSACSGCEPAVRGQCLFLSPSLSLYGNAHGRASVWHLCRSPLKKSAS